MDPAQLTQWIAPHVPSLVAMALVIGVVVLVHKALRHREKSVVKQDHLKKQLLLLYL